ncbi:MFS transporter [Aspergillus clavatus NRRL 1]|uniref:Probable transporter MCH1 n=1 Tax=Aspergillus clavatus (strain ATCC 1007 / CBS 513.65 / DSM 816 / NCTC 3887 / NRRL 1 / QM 1276 / 107) TaxID=344612 RepID=A1CBQ6_ASPCL|nr:MFS monocarboxylic acid transporter, putative [Aspergillus clavatus NRRL 1]EAW13174.1 MFS monocarboxylic acid transporter, putative [Aspergillus clavatus NRRL 1]
MTVSDGRPSAIDRRDFDANRPLLHGVDADDEDRGRSRPDSWLSAFPSLNDGTDGLLTNVVDEIVERDRRKMAKEVIRVCSFILGVVSCLGAGSITAFSLYGPLFLTRLHYTQLRVNAVSIAAEVSMYLPVPLFGYLCDRYTPSPLALASGLVFGSGYLLAAFTYRSGPPPDAGGDGWPFWAMIVAFVAIGTATSCMYLAAVTTCAKNFGRGKHKGIMLAVPIAGFGLSGMWQSQVGTYLLCERRDDGSRGDVDVFRYFVFLALFLTCLGVIGTFGLRIVDEDEEKYIDEAVEELERSGLLEESEFFRPRSEVQAAYGTFSQSIDGAVTEADLTLTLSEEERQAAQLEKEREEEERRKKNWLLNYETRLFLQDHTMWWLALGFFLVTGPGEAYINNLGTIIQTLTPESYPPNAPPPAGLPSTHVTTIALTSTIARLLTGSLSDFFAPRATHLFPANIETGRPSSSSSSVVGRPTLSRLMFLLPSALLLSLGYLLLSSPLPLQHPGLSHITSALIGLGYGSAFSLVPIIVSVVWGVENFGTNWGIVAMVPAAGATMWGVIYSRGYQDATDGGNGSIDGQCHGWQCYGFWAVGCTLSVWVAMIAWVLAWRGWRRSGVVV